MGFRIEDNCVDCGNGCINCGRRHESVFFCDKCDDYADMWNPLYVTDNGEELCWDCYKSMFNEKLCDDMDDSRCEECGCEADFLYEVQPGIWLCEGCLKEMAERVDCE